MRKKKENIVLNSDRTIEKTEALETEREERFDAIDGETSTEAVGPGFTTEPRLERSMQFGDGPLTGESTDPAFSKGEMLQPRADEEDAFGAPRKGRAKGRKRRGKAQVKTVGRHAAARSSKKI